MTQSKKKGASARARPTKPGAEALLGAPVPKAPSGIDGLDEVTAGGLPRGRPSLVIGGPGCGKTMLAAEFIVQGATRYGESGVFMMFEETADELAANVRSLGFDHHVVKPIDPEALEALLRTLAPAVLPPP